MNQQSNRRVGASDIGEHVGTFSEWCLDRTGARPGYWIGLGFTIGFTLAAWL